MSLAEFSKERGLLLPRRLLLLGLPESSAFHLHLIGFLGPAELFEEAFWLFLLEQFVFSEHLKN